jgi:DNA helicase HerA-like ATPase
VSRAVIQRKELMDAVLDFGTVAIDLSDYVTTGVRIVTVGPSGIGKTNAGLLVAEQLSKQGWICVLIDPEGEIASMYGPAVADVDDLRKRLAKRDRPLVVVSARDASEFVPYGHAILEAVDRYRKPIFVMIDEGQVFSAPKKRESDIGEAADIVNELAERGRKRALDLFLTAHRFTGSLHRSIFSVKNLTLIGRLEDPTAWSSIAPMFRASKIEFGDLAALGSGEFFCFIRGGVEKIKMPMAEALKRVAPKAKAVKPKLPSTFSQWDRAMREMPVERLRALTGPVVGLLSTVAGLSSQQMLSGARALQDELEGRR